MSTEIAVLRALLRLSRRRSPATISDLIARVPDAAAHDVHRALAAFARAQLVQRTGEHVRLSLAGLAVAVAAVRHAQPSPARSARPARAKTVGRIVPLVRYPRRHRAA